MKFKHEDKSYIFEMKFMSIVYLLFMIISAFFIIINVLRVIMILVFSVSFYSFYRNIVLKTYIQSVCLDNDKIVFRTGNKTSEFNIEELSDFSIKQYPAESKLNIKVKTKNNDMNKYTLNIPKFDNKEELIVELIKFANKVNPQRKIINMNKAK